MVNQEIKDNILTFLKSKQVAVLSTVLPTGQPIVSTIYFLADDNLCFYFMTKKGRKTENIESNNKVALVVGTENSPVTVQIEGTAKWIEDEKLANARFEQLKEVFYDNPFIAPLFRLEGKEILIYEITPTRIQWLDFRETSERKEVLQVLP